MDVITWLVGGLFFGIIAGVQSRYVSESNKLLDRLRDPEFGRREINSVLDDVILRSARNQTPDWLVYSDRFDRLVELPLERIRQLAGAALATGIVGTMSVFLVDLLLSQFFQST